MKVCLRVFRPLCLVLIMLCFLTSCAGLSDTATKLMGGYELWRMSSYGEKIVFCSDEYTASQAVPAHVESVAFDSTYIFARQIYQNQKNSSTPDKDTGLSLEINYYTIVIGTGEILGPMTHSEFDEWYSTLHRSEALQWISTDNHPAIIAHWKELNPGQSYE